MSEDTNQAPEFNEEDYGQAINMVGQNLYEALLQSIEQMPEPLRSREMILQALSGFMANIIHQQSPNDANASQDMAAHVHKVVSAHLEALTENA